MPTITNKTAFDKALKSIRNRGNNIVDSIQTAIEYCHDQMVQHNNADPVKNLLDTLNQSRLDVRADVRAYLAHHLPVKVGFSKTKGYSVKVIEGNCRELDAPFDKWSRPKNDKQQVSMNADTLIAKFNAMTEMQQTKVIDLFKARFNLVPAADAR